MEKIYLFTGEEELIIKNKIDKVILNAKADAYNIITYDTSDVPLSKAINDCMTPPFLSDAKVIIIKNPIFLTKKHSDVVHNVDLFIKYLNNPSPFTTLVINGANQQFDEKNEAYKLLLQKAEVNKTTKLSRIEAEGWLKRQLAIQGYAIDDSTVKLFFDRMGENLLNAKNEFEKLTTYLKDRRYVTEEDVVNVVTKEIEQDVFKLTKAIIEKDKEKTILIYEDLIKSGKNAVDLFMLVAGSLNNMLTVKELLEKKYTNDDIAKLLGMNVYRVGHLVQDAKKFSRSEIEDKIVEFQTVDYKIKSGQLDASTAVEFALLGI